MPWPEAGSPPHDNVIGIDPQLVDPDRGDYRLRPGSPAAGYGCQSFGGPPVTRAAVDDMPRAAARRGLPLQDVGGSITVDTVWDADTVRVNDDVLVSDGVTLTIAAGTFVEFQGRFGLDVQGRLLALGEPVRRIRFAPPASAAAGGAAWRGISFRFTPETNEPSLLRFCRLEAAADSLGGALTFVGFSRCRVENTVLSGNTAHLGGAVYCSHFASPELVGCLIVGNHAQKAGAAIYCLDAYARLINCTIADNVDVNPEYMDRAAAVTAMLSKPSIMGGIVWANPSNYFLDEQLIQTKAHYVRYSDVEFGHPGEGNIALDPLFNETGAHPYALMDGSPCRDSGAPDSTGLRLPLLDLAGGPRLAGSLLDVGSYEGDGIVGTLDETLPVGDMWLEQNFPNPFNPRTTIAFTLPRAGIVRLAIHDAAGRLVCTPIPDVPFAAGRHELRWNGRDETGRAVAAGLYVCRLRVGSRVDRRGMILLR